MISSANEQHSFQRKTRPHKNAKTRRRDNNVLEETLSLLNNPNPIHQPKLVPMSNLVTIKLLHGEEIRRWLDADIAAGDPEGETHGIP